MSEQNFKKQLEDLLRFQECCEMQIAGLRKKIEEQEEQENKKFPQNGEEYFYIISIGHISQDVYDGNMTDLQRLAIGNMFKTKEEAAFEVERLKVLKELKEISKSFEFYEPNFYLTQLVDKEIEVACTVCFQYDTIFFASEGDAESAIEAVGEERIKKYYLGIKEN